MLAKSRSLQQWLLTGAVALALAAIIAAIALDEHYQWDFRVFYAAVGTFADGGIPYAPEHSDPLWPRGLPFMYPPLALYALRWITLVPLSVAMHVWLGLKLAAIALLVRLWHLHFEPLGGGWPVLLLLALGFNAALLRDLASGNLSTFEELGIWFAFSLLLRDRPYAAAVILAIVGQFKLLPATLIGVIPLVHERTGWRAFFVGGAVFLGLLSLNLIIEPALTNGFLDQLTHSGYTVGELERGEINPSSLALFRDLADITRHFGGLPASLAAGTFAYLAFLVATAILVVVIVLRSNLRKADPRLLIYCACALFAVTMPRMKDYTYILMLIPTLHLARCTWMRGPHQQLLFLVALTICSQSSQAPIPRFRIPVLLIQNYMPLLMAAVVLICLLRAALRTDIVHDDRAATRALELAPASDTR
jgi:hypothetical protein